MPPPPLAGGGTGAGSCWEGTGGFPAPSWSRKRWAKASGSWRSSAACVTRSSTPTNCVVAGCSPYGRCREGPAYGGRSLGPDARVGGVRSGGRLLVERSGILVRAGGRRRVRGAVVESLAHRVLGGQTLRPVGVLLVGVLEVRVRRPGAVLARLRRNRRPARRRCSARALPAVPVVRRVHRNPYLIVPGRPATTDIAQRSTFSPVSEGSPLSGPVSGVGSLGCSGPSPSPFAVSPAAARLRWVYILMPASTRSSKPPA